LQEFNQSYYDELAENAKNNIEKVVELVKKPWDSATDLQNALYAIPIDKTDDDKQKKTKQKQFFKHLYNLITGNNKGPKLGLFLLALGQDKVISLLKK
jgi:lysyl-tRNA synthetase class 1